MEFNGTYDEDELFIKKRGDFLEKTWIEKAKAGDQEAFQLLMEKHQTKVYNLALRMVKHPEDALDLSQEAFFKAWKSLEFYREESSFATWLYRLTTNVCLDFLRKEQRQAHDSIEGEQGTLEIHDPQGDAHHQTVEKMEREAVNQALSQLPEDYRAPFVLRVVNELSYQEIGEALDLKIGTVKSRIARAREKMSEILTKSGTFSHRHRPKK